MQNVYRLGKRRSAWLALPLAVAAGAATVLLWPQSTPVSVLVAKRDLSAGTVLSPADFELKNVQLGDSASLYLNEFPGNAVVAYRVSRGQLVARSAVSPNPITTLLPTVLQFKDPLPSKVAVGSRVDVWATERAGEPAPIALECQVSNLRSETSLGQKLSSVEVNCTSEFLPSLLRAKANGDYLSLVLQPTLLEQ